MPGKRVVARVAGCSSHADRSSDSAKNIERTADGQIGFSVPQHRMTSRSRKSAHHPAAAGAKYASLKVAQTPVAMMAAFFSTRGAVGGVRVVALGSMVVRTPL